MNQRQEHMFFEIHR